MSQSVTSATQALPGLDLTLLADHLDRVRPGLRAGDLRGEVVAGGRSNLTYFVSDGSHDWVLRRPPLGHVLATAHDMMRESRVVAALGASAVPVPHVVMSCDDAEVLGAPFYLMDRVEGTVYRSRAETETLSAPQARSVSQRVVDVLVDLHRVSPGAVGLADLGRPDGFAARQLRRWSQQMIDSRSRELAGLDQLLDDLAASVPARAEASILHGDYRLDNMIVGADLEPAAVLDWEMSTIGDPLMDVGLFHVYWCGLGRGADDLIGRGVTPGTDGFLSGAELLERYLQGSGIEADPGDLAWYVAFGYFKLAAILEGIHYRYLHGQTVGEGFDLMADLVPPLIEQGRATLARAGQP